MPVLRPAASGLFTLLALATGLCAAEPVRRVPIYVQPYYASADKPDGRPQVQVGQAYDALLASSDPADIRKARDLVEASPDVVSPMTMMVLAIRLYDTGQRDDAVFWFYVAKDRYLSLVGVVDENALGSAPDAVRSFATLAGPVINSYAFCDVDRQLATNDKAWRWVAAHPYMTAFLPALPAKPGDREANLKKAVDGLKASADKARAQFADPAFLKDLQARREAKGVPADYCWK